MNAFSPVISVAAQLESQMVKMLSMVFLQLATFWGLQFVFSLWCPLDHITGRLRVQFFSVDFFIFLNTSAVVHETWKTSKIFINRLQCWQTHYYFSEKKNNQDCEQNTENIYLPAENLWLRFCLHCNAFTYKVAAALFSK